MQIKFYLFSFVKKINKKANKTAGIAIPSWSSQFIILHSPGYNTTSQIYYNTGKSTENNKHGKRTKQHVEITKLEFMDDTLMIPNNSFYYGSIINE